MKRRIETPFDTIENAQQYIGLLAEAVAESKHDIDHEITLATEQMSHRRVEALRVVEYNLEKLQRYLSDSGRALNALRSLRRLLLEERPATSAAHDTKAAKAANDAKRHQAARTSPLTGTISTSEPLRVGEIQAVATS